MCIILLYNIYKYKNKLKVPLYMVKNSLYNVGEKYVGVKVTHFF
nr:MAG TPA: hypothetical protein [Bacteriophage sp.]